MNKSLFFFIFQTTQAFKLLSVFLKIYLFLILIIILKYHDNYFDAKIIILVLFLMFEFISFKNIYNVYILRYLHFYNQIEYLTKD